MIHLNIWALWLQFAHVVNMTERSESQCQVWEGFFGKAASHCAGRNPQNHRKDVQDPASCGRYFSWTRVCYALDSLFGGVLNAPKGDPISGKSKTVQMYGDVWGISFPCNNCIVWVGVVWWPQISATNYLRFGGKVWTSTGVPAICIASRYFRDQWFEGNCFFAHEMARWNTAPSERL